MSNSEQDPGFVCLLLVAILVGCLTEGMLADSLPEPPPEPDARLPIFTLTGRDENGRQTLDYGENSDASRTD